MPITKTGSETVRAVPRFWVTDMTRHEKTRAAILAVLMLTMYGLACLVEPCDGYSCHNQTTITE
jgi:hypothetical protein